MNYGGGSGEFRLWRAPAQSVTWIKYYALDGTLTTLDTSIYTVDVAAEPARIWPAYTQVWPAARLVPQAINIRYVAGYGLAASVPDEIKHALKLLIGTWYENRESVIVGTISSLLPSAVESLLWSRRIMEVY